MQTDLWRGTRSSTDEKTSFDDYKIWTEVLLTQTRVTGALLCSQAWRWSSLASAWWPGLYLWGSAGLSPKRQRGPKRPLPMGSPPKGGAKGIGCNVSWGAAEGGDLGGPDNCLCLCTKQQFRVPTLLESLEGVRERHWVCSRGITHLGLSGKI